MDIVLARVCFSQISTTELVRKFYPELSRNGQKLHPDCKMTEFSFKCCRQERQEVSLERPAVNHRTHHLLGCILALSASNQAKAIMYHYLIVLVLCVLEVFTV